MKGLINEGTTSLPITHPEMTRFWLSLQDGVDFVLKNFGRMLGGEIFIPKIPSYKITDVATAIGPQCKQEIVGIRPGEKIHEEMITSSDSYNTHDLGTYYTILPQHTRFKMDDYNAHFKAKKVPQGFNYNSGDNTDWVTVEEMRELINTKI